MDKERILVVDDDERWHATIARILQGQYDLAFATGASQSLEFVRSAPFALAILDQRLGPIAGIDLLDRLREIQRDLPAIILTGYPGVEDADSSIVKGITGYLSKRNRQLRTVLRDRIASIMANHNTIAGTRVFFCYSHQDKEQVTEYYWKLTKLGFRVFIDDDIIPGKDWEETIADAIENAHRFVYFLSSHSYNRTGDMRKEINTALGYQEKRLRNSIFFIPARLDDCAIEKNIRQFQVVDLFRPNGFERLLKALTTD